MATEDTKSLGIVGTVLGMVALSVGVMHFWAGPIEPPPPLETVVADKVVKIRDAVVAKLGGVEYVAEAEAPDWGPDRLLTLATLAVALAAIALGTASYIRRESIRVSGSAVLLGGAAIGIQYLGLAIGLIFFAILIAAVIGQLGIDIG